MIAAGPPSDWDVCRDVTLSRQVRGDAWERFERGKWLDAFLHHRCTEADLEPRFREFIDAHLKERQNELMTKGRAQ